MITAHGREIVHRVKGRNLIRPHIRHAEIVRDIFDHRHRQPALRLGFFADLTLRQVKQRHHGRLLPSGGVAADIHIGFGLMFRRKGKAAPCRAGFGFVGNCY